MVVDSRPELRIGACLEQKPDSGYIPFADGHMQRRVVVDAALIRIGPELEQQLHDVEHVGPRRAAGLRSGARERRHQRRKPGVIFRLRVGADLEQRADERDRAVIDRVLEAWSDRQRHRAIRHVAGIFDGRQQGGEIARTKGGVDLHGSFVLGAWRHLSTIIALRLPAPLDVKIVVSKVRRRLIPFVFLLYIVAYLDRINVGFAGLQMNAALGLSASEFGLGAGIFFVSYTLLEVPSNVVLARIGPRLWIARIMITWGLVSSGMMFVQGPASFYVMR